MAGYTYANTFLFTGYLLAKTDESIYVFTFHDFIPLKCRRTAACPRYLVAFWMARASRARAGLSAKCKHAIVGFSDNRGAICLITVDPNVPNGQKLHYPPHCP